MALSDDAQVACVPGGVIRLTERQVEALVLLAWGEPVRCIARELYVSVATVNHDLARLRRIFKARNVTALVVSAMAAGVLTADGRAVRGAGRLVVGPEVADRDRSGPLWTDPARRGRTEADPRRFSPDHSDMTHG